MDPVKQLKLNWSIKKNRPWPAHVITFKDKLAEVSNLSDNFKIWCSQFEALFFCKSYFIPKRQSVELSVFKNRETTASIVIS